MTDWKKIAGKILFPPMWLMIILTIISTVALVWVFVCGMEMHPIAYGIYVVSFYTVSVVGVFLVMVLPKQYKSAKKKIYDTKYGNRYMTDVAFRTKVSLYATFVVNVLYVFFNLASGYWYHTRWFYIFALYYSVLAIMRFLLLKYINNNEIGTNLSGEWKRSRACAMILTLINLTLSGAVLMMMYQDRGFEYHGILIYVMAMYTFYITTAAIVRIVKYRKYKSPVMTTTKIITLAAALVSMLSLETAMFASFGADMTIESKRIMIAATGAGICVIVLAMSGYMIVRSTKEIRKLEEENVL